MQRRSAGFLLAALVLLAASLGVDLPASPHPEHPRTGLVLASATLARPAVQGAVPTTAPTTARTPARSTGHATRARVPKRCRSGLVVLTFDDGPSPSLTPRLVKILTDRNVPATFFMVGVRIRSAPAAARLVQRRGFTIGNHTWSHAELPALSDRRVRHQLRSTRRAMRAHGIVPSDLMRPPYGAITRRVRHDVRGLGLVPVLWSIDSRDWTGGSPRQIADRVLRGLRKHGTNVVLQHDGVANSPSSIAAVPRIIREARRRGYCFTDLGPRGKPIVPGTTPPAPAAPVTPSVGTPAPARYAARSVFTVDLPVRARRR